MVVSSARRRAAIYALDGLEEPIGGRHRTRQLQLAYPYSRHHGGVYTGAREGGAAAVPSWAPRGGGSLKVCAPMCIWPLTLV